MSHIGSKNTKIELLLRHALFAKGYRYRVNDKRLPGTPDIVLPKYHTVIFINGCFWHGHKNCSYSSIPKTNSWFWEEKITHNQERDSIVVQKLESMSWNVITVWECELKPATFKNTIAKVEEEMLSAKTQWEYYQSQRRSDRDFALCEKRRKELLLTQVLSELGGDSTIPPQVARLSKNLCKE